MGGLRDPGTLETIDGNECSDVEKTTNIRLFQGPSKYLFRPAVLKYEHQNNLQGLLMYRILGHISRVPDSAGRSVMGPENFYFQ